MLAHRPHRQPGGGLMEFNQERVWILLAYPERLEHKLRKIPAVPRDDGVRATLDCGGQHMAVVGVRQGECLDPVLVADDETIRNSAVHQLAQNEQAILGQVWTVPEQSANPLVMYRIGPPGMEESSARLPNGRSR